jgi:hypothetical protein
MSAAIWFPKTEKLGPDEMQIIFMGTAPAIRPGQMNTSVFVRLGNGDSFIFDIGEGAIANYVAGGLALNELNNIFLTHLHIDHFGAPDGVVVNATKDDIWVREGILPDYPNMRAPQQDFSDGALVVPVPNQQRVDTQEPFIREKEIDPEKYYPEGYHPELMTEWPVDTDLVVPVEVLPETMAESMGENWRDRQAYKKHISALSAGSGSEE